MKNVNWSFITSHVWDTDHHESVMPLIADLDCPYESLTKYIVSTRKNSTFLKCPAHTDFIKNIFVFYAPFDLTFNIELSDGRQQVIVDNISQNMFDNIIDLRFLNDNQNYPLLGIDWLSVFTCDQSMNIQIMPAFLHDNDFIKKTNLIPGEFNIGKWTRPIEPVFELKCHKDTIKIQKGDAIAYFKFNDTEHIKLNKASTPWAEIELCNKIRESAPFRPLKERYQSLNEERIRKGNV